LILVAGCWITGNRKEERGERKIRRQRTDDSGRKAEDGGYRTGYSKPPVEYACAVESLIGCAQRNSTGQAITGVNSTG